MHAVQAGDAAIPALGLGTWKAKGDACQRACEHALEVGMRHIDTAQLYDNERPVGRALASTSVPREEVFLTTKVWRDTLEPAAATASIEESLRALGTHVDLLLIHWPDPAVPLEATLDAMDRFVQRGDVRHLGVSNFPSALVRRAAAHTHIVCNQVEYHPYLRQEAVIQTCRELSVAVAAYCPLAQGRVVEDPVLTEIGRSHGKTAAQMTLAWLVAQPGVVALPKSTNPGRIEQNSDIHDLHLTDAERTRIDGLARGLRLVDPPRFAIEWDPPVHG